MFTSEELTAPFWAAAEEGRLVRPVCDRCSTSFFVPSLACPACQSEEWIYVESSGAGRVYSCTTVYQGPDSTWEVPYTLVLVDLEEGWSMLSRLVEPTGAEPDRDHELIGSRVTVTFRAEGREPHRTLPVFEVVS